MKVSIKLYTNKKLKNGYPVTIFFSAPGIRKRVSLGWYFQMDEWDFEREMPIPSSADFDFVYPKLLNFKQQIKQLVYNGETDIDTYLAILNNNVKLTVDFYTFADGLIAELKLKNRQSNAKVYQTAVDQFRKIKPNLLFSDINYNTLRDFKTAKLKTPVKNSTVHLYLRTFRAIYNEAVLVGATTDFEPFKNVFKDLAVRKNRTKKKYLTIKGIRKLEKLNNLPEGQQFTCDLFLLQFYFGGQDLIDIYNLKKDQLKNGRVYFTRKKLGERGYEFDLAIIDKAQLILNKYKNETNFVLPGRKDYAGYETFRRRYQKNLNELKLKANLKVKPKDDNLGIKVARYTFANCGKLLGIDEDMLRELMGHERNEIDTIYKDKHPQKKRDKAHLKIVST